MIPLLARISYHSFLVRSNHNRNAPLLEIDHTPASTSGLQTYEINKNIALRNLALILGLST